MDTTPDFKARVVRDQRQKVGFQWVARVFGERFLTRYGRAERVIEESIEIAQALDFPKERIHELVEQVYANPKGELGQEIGGLGLSLLTLGETTGYSVDQCEQDELARVLSKPTDHFKERLAAKVASGVVTEEAA